MEENVFARWCEDATSQIRYKPDRRQVYQELMDHLTDRKMALWDKGMTEEEAIREALKAMGSSAEIAPQLARIHRPLWGYVYRVLRIAAIILCAFALYIAIFSTTTLVRDLFFSGRNPAYLSPDLSEDWQLHTYAAPNASAWCDGYWIRIQEAALWTRDDKVALTFPLEIMDFNYFWQSSSLSEHLWAVDSNGNHYGTIPEVRYNGLPGLVWRGSQSSGRFSSQSITVRGIPSADLEWIEIHYDRDGRNLVFRIVLVGGDTQ